jgi:Protein of unknown function (DUF2924)
MEASIVAEIAQLRELKTAALRVRYREVYGEESRSSNREFLFRRIAWRLQAKAEGDLSERARRQPAFAGSGCAVESEIHPDAGEQSN